MHGIPSLLPVPSDHWLQQGPFHHCIFMYPRRKLIPQIRYWDGYQLQYIYNFWYTLSATELSQDLWLSNPYCPAMRGGLVVFYPITSGLQRYPVELPSLFCFPDVRLVLVRQQIKHRAAKMSEFSTHKMQCYKVSKSNLYIAIVPLWKEAKPTPFKWINDNAHFF